MKRKLTADKIPSQEAVSSILRRIEGDKYKDELGDLVMADPEAVKEMYNNPLWSIIESSEEAKFEEQMLKLLDSIIYQRGLPGKKMDSNQMKDGHVCAKLIE